MTWLRTDDRWLAWDKAAHLTAAAGIWVLVAGGYGPLAAWCATFGAGVLVELVELGNYRTWQRAGFPGRPRFWPYLTDLVSWRDLLADAAGAGLAWVGWAVLR